MPIRPAVQRPVLFMGDNRCPTPEMEVETENFSKMSGISSQERPIKKPKRSIRFNPEVHVQETTHVNDMTDDEIEAYWFCREEFGLIKKRYQVTVRLVVAGKNITGSKEHCIRGLEYRTREGARARHLNKLTALGIVLDEQERQRLCGITSDESLSRVYQRISSRCLHASHLMALKDQEEVYGPEDNRCTTIEESAAEQAAQRRNGASRSSIRIKQMFKLH